MDIEWLAFLIVAAVTLVAAVVVVGSYSLAIRLLAPADDGRSPGPAQRAGAYACFAVCVAAVLLGVYLLVPALGG